MSWFPISDDLYSDPRFMRLSDAALALYCRAGAWCAHWLTDGHLPGETLGLLRATEDAANELVTAGIWHVSRRDTWGESHVTNTHDDAADFQFAEWPRHATREAVERRKKADTARQRSYRRSKRETAVSRRDTPRDTTQDNDSDMSVTATVNHAPPLPNSVPNGTGAPAPDSDDSNKIHAGTVVASWAEAFEAATGRKPSTSMRGQAGREARTLLNGGGGDPQLIIEAAKAAGAKGFATIDREYNPLAAQRKKAEVKRDPGTGRGVDW
jgi:hypothetical protein